MRSLSITAIAVSIAAAFIAPHAAHAAVFEATTTIGHLIGGNPSFTLNGANNVPNDIGMHLPAGVVVDTAGHRLFVGDSNNYRILVYPLNSNGTLASRNPSYVLGQADAFATGGNSVATSSVGVSFGLAYDAVNERLFVAEHSLNRILVFDVATSTIVNDEAASHVLGQPDLATFGFGTSSSTLSGVKGLAYDSVHQRLFSAENSDGNQRVLAWDLSGGITDGMPASHVLGQPDFDSTVWGGTIASTSVNNVKALAYDPIDDRLFVGDITGRRVLIFDTAAITDGMPASHMLGQNDFTAFPGNSTTNASSTLDVEGLAFDAGHHRLYVAQGQRNRIMVFDVSSSTLVDGEQASFVLGQSGFATSNSGTSSTTLSIGSDMPAGMAFDSVNDHLFVSDATNNRVVWYDTGSIANGMAASEELGHQFAGQPTFAYGNADNGPGDSSLNAAEGSAIDPDNHRLFVADTQNSRVMVFPLDANDFPSSYTATYILGEPDAFTNSGGGDQATMVTPMGLAYDRINQRLFVAENGNNRVTVWNVAPGTIATGMNASHVLGQPDFLTTIPDVSSSTMDLPAGVAYDPVHQRLFVSEQLNNRVLVFDADPATMHDAEPASFVIGHPDFISTLGGTSSTTLAYPTGIAYATSSQFLFVADRDNNRVTVYDASHLANDMPARYVLGQQDLVSSGTGTSSSTMKVPYGVAYDPIHQRLFVAEDNNYRVTGFDVATSSIATGMGATLVLGEPDFATAAPSTGATGFGIVHGVAYDTLGKNLYINDGGNNRILVYAPIKIATVSLPAATAGQSYAQSISVANAQGTVSFALAGGTLPSGMSIGSVDGTPTDPGTYTFTVRAADALNGAGQFYDDQTYTLMVNPASSGGSGTTGNIALGNYAGGGGVSVSASSSTSSGQGASGAATSTDIAALQAQIQLLLAKIAALKAQLGLSAGPGGGSSAFTRDLTMGSGGDDVYALQQFLIDRDLGPAAAALRAHGLTHLFWALTKEALIEYQKAKGIQPAVGYFGPLTRAAVNAGT